MGDTITIQVPLTFRKHPYERIRLVGYSCGATLARKVFLAAWGEAEDVPGGDRTPVWAPAIERVMSVAGINSGWTVTCALSWASTTLWTLLQGVGEFHPFRNPTIFDYRLGSRFLVATACSGWR